MSYKAPEKKSRLDLFLPEKIKRSLEAFSERSFQTLNTTISLVLKEYFESVPIHEQPTWAAKAIDPSDKVRVSFRIPAELKKQLQVRCPSRGEKTAIVVEAISRFARSK